VLTSQRNIWRNPPNCFVKTLCFCFRFGLQVTNFVLGGQSQTEIRFCEAGSRLCETDPEMLSRITKRTPRDSIHVTYERKTNAEFSRFHFRENQKQTFSVRSQQNKASCFLTMGMEYSVSCFLSSLYENSQLHSVT
jgi:hypothetical protein